MRARDQCSIFSIGGKFCPDYGLLLELHPLTLVTRSYALLITYMQYFPNSSKIFAVPLFLPIFFFEQECYKML